MVLFVKIGQLQQCSPEVRLEFDGLPEMRRRVVKFVIARQSPPQTQSAAAD